MRQTTEEDRVSGRRRVVSCDLHFVIGEPAEIVLQVMAAQSAGRVVEERFEVATDGAPPDSSRPLSDRAGQRLHTVCTAAGLLTVGYRAEIEPASAGSAVESERSGGSPPDAGLALDGDLDWLVYSRPSRYCPSDHLIGFAVAEFGAGPDVTARVSSITEWIRQRIGYVLGSSGVHDSAEDTLLTGVGSCRDFAHLAIALCRATGIPARFAAVYAPGLSPMDFHAVFETLEGGRWLVHDATGLAPRSSLVRIATGRDAADTAFASIMRGIADLRTIEVTATVAGDLPPEDPTEPLELA